MVMNMSLTKTNYIFLFGLFCALFYYITTFNVFENFENDSYENIGDTMIDDTSHPYIRNDYDELDKPYHSEIHNNLLFNEDDNIKYKYRHPTSRTTGMMTKTDGYN